MQSAQEQYNKDQKQAITHKNQSQLNRVLVNDAELSFIQVLRRTYPAHYALFNNEIYFSNMLIADWRLRDRTYKILLYVSNCKLFDGTV